MSRGRLIAVLCAVVVVAGGGVAVLSLGGADEEETPERAVSDPLGEALAYLPADARAVAVFQTGGEQAKALSALLDKLIVGPVILRQLVGGLGLDVEEDVRPLLGSPLVIAASRTPGLDLATTLRQGGLAALTAPSGKELRETLSDAAGAGRLTRVEGPDEVYSGARGSIALAADGPVLVLARDAAGARAAIERRAARTGLRREDHARRVAAVAPAAKPAPLVTLTAPAQALVQLAGVGEIPNADALTDGAVGVRIGEKDVTIPFAAAADAERFKPENLPIPLGPAAPSPAPGNAPSSLAIRDARQTLEVLRRQETRTNLTALRAIEEALEELDQVSGLLKSLGRIDIDKALFDQLTGTTTVTREANATVVRAELQDGDPLRTALDRIAKVPSFAYELAGIDGVALDREGEEAFVLKLEGEKPVRLAVLGTTLVATTSPTIGLRAVANREPTTVRTPGALHARLTRPAELLVQRFGLPGATSVLLGGLGPLDVAVQAERTGLTGSATLRVAR